MVTLRIGIALVFCLPHPHTAPPLLPILAHPPGAVMNLDALTINQPAVRADLFDLVGNTPLIPLRRIFAARPGVELYAKAEWFNPSGSVKDRPAREIILSAERAGDLLIGWGIWMAI